MNHCRIALVGALMLLTVPVLTSGPSFAPDVTFNNVSMGRVVGDTEWRMRGETIVGTPKAAGSGGWLMLDPSFEDVGVFASFRCAGGCKVGLLLRATKTADGLSGAYVSLSDDQVGLYEVTLDAQGKEIGRESLRVAGGALRVAPPPPPSAPPPDTVPPVVAPPSAFKPPIEMPKPGIRARDWNEIEVTFDANIVRVLMNDRQAASGAVSDDAGRYGPVGFYVGGAGEVEFKGIGIKDLSLKKTPIEELSPRFTMRRLNTAYYGWAATSADFNRDGHQDIAIGPHIYFGPSYTEYREFALGAAVSPSTAYSWDWMETYSHDFTGDGWPDILAVSHGPGIPRLYANPRGERRHWDNARTEFRVASEVTVLRDLSGNGVPELVFLGGTAGQLTVRAAKPNPANPLGPWLVREVSESAPWPQHGIGVGDVNGDRRMDIVGAYGWWEQPSGGQLPWPYHPEPFGKAGRVLPGGGEMSVYDVNGDGFNDIVTSLAAHGFGLAWFEQKRSPQGAILFERHMIMDDFSTQNAGGVTFSQLHGSTAADIDRDGIPDFIVGKRYWAHQDAYYDPDPYGAAVLYVYRTVRNPKAPGGAEFVPELVHNGSGVGASVLARDLNGDGALDIVTATKLGSFVFINRGKPGSRR